MEGRGQPLHAPLRGVVEGLGLRFEPSPISSDEHGIFTNGYMLPLPESGRETVAVALNCGTNGHFLLFDDLNLSEGIIPEEKAEGLLVDVEDKKCAVSFTAASGAPIATYATWSLTLEKGAPLPDSNRLKVTLRSPESTESVLVDAPNGLPADSAFVNMRVGANAFLDEQAATSGTFSGGITNGGWHLRIEEIDDPEHPKESGDVRTFKAENLVLELYGHAQ